MPLFFKPLVKPPDTQGDDVRLGQLLGRRLEGAGQARAALLGYPSDIGVARNGGRVGAAQAPDKIREALFKLTPDPRQYDAFVDLIEHTLDVGNVVLDADMEEDQEHLGQVVASYLTQGTVPIILGGGHETSFGHFLGYVDAGQPVSILNWDAHPDVRPLKDGEGHSGSPFRQAILHPFKNCISYTVAGLLPHSVARNHLNFIVMHGGSYIWRDTLTRERIDHLYHRGTEPLMVSFDIDAVDQAFAPGVSAPATGGLTADLWLYAAYQAGRNPRVRSMDIVECNPVFDRDTQTSRLAALTIWWFLKGLAERSLAEDTQHEMPDDGSPSE